MGDRKLLAIVFIDVVGFTKMAAADEENALFLLDNAVKMLKATIKRYQGRWLKQVGDGSLCAFDSAVNAVLCAQEIQRCFMMNEELQLRIGIHIGDVVVSQGDIYGDGVNVAARIQNQAEVGGIVVSEEVHNALASHPNINDQLLGESFLKGVGRGLQLYKVEISQDLPTSALPAELRNSASLSANSGSLNQHWYQMVGLASPLLGNAMLIIGLIIILIVWQTTDYLNSEESTSSDASIAVLPFKNFTNDTNFDYYGEAISEEMLNVLAKSPDLHIASRTSSFDPVFRDSSFKQIVETLQVSYIVEGSIRKTNNVLRVTAQFIRASDNKHLLSKNYDLTDENWIKQQENVSFDYVEKIGEVLDIDVSPYLVRDNRVFEDSEAQLKFNKIITTIDSFDSTEISQQHLTMVNDFIAKHPTFSPAYSYLCRFYLNHYLLQFGETSHINNAKYACEKAEKLDPYSYSVKLANAQLLLVSGEFDVGIKVTQALVETFPKRAEPHFLQGDFLFAMDNVAEGVASYKKGFGISANYWKPYLNLAYNLIGVGEFNAAKEYLLRYVALKPDDPVGHENLGVVELYLGDFSAAEQEFSKALALQESYSNLSNIGTASYYVGHYQLAIEYYRRALNIDGNDHRVWGNLAQATKFQANLTETSLDTSAGTTSTVSYASVLQTAIERANVSLSINDKDASTNAALAFYYQLLKQIALSDSYFQRAKESAEQNFESQYYLALNALYRQQQHEAIEHLQASIELGFPASFIAQDPEFRSLHNEPSFQRLIGNN